jgi:NAD(P)-dependent dehydrogenase (short-subunit alcohol dehydrogenase family)
MTIIQEDNGVNWADVSLPGVDSSTIAIVLGAAGAIGGETVRAFAAAGATVALVSRSVERSTKAAASVKGPGRVLPLAADMADSDSLQRLVDDVLEQAGPPSVLVNSAAVGADRQDPTTVTREQVATIFAVNVLGAFEAARTVIPPMRERGGGKIVNVSSIAAQRTLPGSAPYASSKAALNALTRSLAVDLGPDGITVNSVSPGQTPTKLRSWDERAGVAGPPMGSPDAVAGIPLRRRGRLEDYVGAILFLSSSLSDYVTGVDMPVEGGGRLVRAKSY